MGIWEKIVISFFQFAPNFVVCLTFLPCGLVFGYTMAAFVAERQYEVGVIVFGPLILGACWGLVTALLMFGIKFIKGRIIYWHIEILLVAGAFHLIASFFYFAEGLDNTGAFISYLAHSLTFLAGFSFMHATLGKGSRAIVMSISSCCYLLGLASAVSLIAVSYSKNLDKYQGQNATQEQLIDGIYVNFAALYLSIGAAVLAILIGLRVLAFLGKVDCSTSMDDDFRIANANGTLFDKRQDVIKRIQFFYVTKNQQWNITFLLIFTEAIQFALFVYFIFWFSVNDAMRLTETRNIDQMLWTIFAGAVVGTVALRFISVKVSYVANQCALMLVTIAAMIICSYTGTKVPFWIILFFFGMPYSSLQIVLVEVTHFRLTELFIYLSYFLKLLSTSVIYYYFVSNSKNSYFSATDESTLMAQGFIFLVITSLLALVVGMKVPRTYKRSLIDIQHDILGIIFMEHQIEQLNVKWLNDGTIPTITNPDEY